MLGLGLIGAAAIIATIRKYPKGDRPTLIYAMKKLGDAIPSLMLIVIVIGGIIGGIFTATEASAIAVLYSLLLSVVFYKEVKVGQLSEILLKTVEITAMVMLLIGASSAMSWILSYENIPQSISHALVSMTESKFLILLIINLILLVVGTFMDMTPAVLIFTPIFLPVVATLGISPLHFGIMMILNLCIGLTTPPVGTVLFVGCGIGKTTIGQLARSLMPFYVVMIAVLMLITYIPWLTEALPRLFGYI